MKPGNPMMDSTHPNEGMIAQSIGDYQDALAGFAHLRVRAGTLSAFGFKRKGKAGWLYAEAIPGTSLECRVAVTTAGKLSETVVDPGTGDEYIQYRMPDANGAFIGQVREAVTSLLNRIAAACFERDVFRLEQSLALLETARCRWGEELEYLWEDSPEYAVLRRADTEKWYAVLMRLPRRKFGLAGDEVSEFVLLRIPPDDAEAIHGDSRFLPAFHMNKRTWFAMPLDGGADIAEILRRMERSRELAVKMMIDERLIHEVLSIVGEIPAGRVATYGQLAGLAGRKRNSRLVGTILSMADLYGEYPCHRVVNHAGRLAPGFTAQRALLEAEGVRIKTNGLVDMPNCQWEADGAKRGGTTKKTADKRRQK